MADTFTSAAPAPGAFTQNAPAPQFVQNAPAPTNNVGNSVFMSPAEVAARTSGMATSTGTWQGYILPFTESIEPVTMGGIPVKGGGTVKKYRDADGREVPPDVYQSWVDSGKPYQPPREQTPEERAALATGGGLNLLTPEGVKSAQQVYLDAVKQGRDLYGDVGSGPTQPRPTDIAASGKVLFDPITGQKVEAQPDIQVFERQGARVESTDTSGLAAAGNVNIQPGQVVAGNVTPEQMAQSQRLNAALQQGTTVQGADTTKLQEIEAGQGAIQQQTAALLRLSSQRDAERKAGLVAQARGNQRAGALRQALRDKTNLETEDRIVAQQTAQQLAATNKLADLDQQKKQLQAQLDAAKASNDQNEINSIQTKMAELDQQREQVNAQLRQQASEGNVNRQVEAQKFNIGTDVDVKKFAAGQKLQAETSIAQLTQQKNIAQSQLDDAMLSGNQQAINAAKMKKADIDAQIAAENARLAQDADKTNLGTSVDVQKFTTDTALRAQDQQEKQRVADADMRIRAQKALEDSAKGLLTEDQRQQELAFAKQRLRMAEQELQIAIQRNDREAQKAAQERIGFWADMTGRILGTAARAATTGGAAHGGVVTKPTKLLVGEGSHDEVIIPVTGITRALKDALSVENKPFDSPVPIERLLRAIQGAPAEEDMGPPPGIALLLAPENNRARKMAY